MHYPDSRWQSRCQGKSCDDVSERITTPSKMTSANKCTYAMIFTTSFWV